MFVQYHDPGAQLLFWHEQPPAIHEGQLRLAQGVPARMRLVHPAHACTESPYLQKAQSGMRTTVTLAR